MKNNQTLRAIAEKTKHAGEALVMPFEQRIAALEEFKMEFTPVCALALLEELEAAETRIAELSASHSKLHEGMAAIYNAICADGASTSLSAILTFVKRAFEESKAAAGITVKGE